MFFPILSLSVHKSKILIALTNYLIQVAEMSVNYILKDISFPKNYTVEQVNFKSFSDKDWTEFLTLDELIEQENDPELPYSPEFIKRRMLLDPPNIYLEHWIVRLIEKPFTIVGFCLVNVLTPESPDYNTNGKTVRTWIATHPDHRNKGLGTAFVSLLCQRGLELGKTEISFSASALSGQNFMKRFTTKIALDAAENRLTLKEVNWESIEQWHTESKLKSPTTVVETYESIPDDVIVEFAKLQTSVLNDVPFGDLGLKFTITPDQIRKWENFSRQLKNVSITKITREQDGRISGMTEIKVNTSLPTVIDQGLTGVLREFRGRNLGMLLKSEMLLTIKERFPNAQFIITGNADENAPMLRINHALGFKRACSWKAYKFQIDELVKKLN